MKDRTTAIVVGLLFLAADAAGVLSLPLLQSTTAGDYLTQVAPNGGRVATGALLVLVMGLAVVAIAVAIHPVLARFSERLALGYVVARTVEGMVDVLSALAALLILSVSQQFVASGGSSASLQALGALLRADSDWVNNALMPIVFGLDALILNYVLYRAGLVPRWLSAWGLGGAALWLAAGVMVTYGLQPSAANPMAAPIALQEIALAAWLIFKGFNRTAFAGKPEPEPARTWRTT